MEVKKKLITSIILIPLAKFVLLLLFTFSLIHTNKYISKNSYNNNYYKFKIIIYNNYCLRIK